MNNEVARQIVKLVNKHVDESSLEEERHRRIKGIVISAHVCVSLIPWFVPLIIVQTMLRIVSIMNAFLPYPPALHIYHLADTNAWLGILFYNRASPSNEHADYA